MPAFDFTADAADAVHAIVPDIPGESPAAKAQRILAAAFAQSQGGSPTFKDGGMSFAQAQAQSAYNAAKLMNQAAVAEAGHRGNLDNLGKDMEALVTSYGLKGMTPAQISSSPDIRAIGGSWAVPAIVIPGQTPLTKYGLTIADTQGRLALLSDPNWVASVLLKTIVVVPTMTPLQNQPSHQALADAVGSLTLPATNTYTRAQYVSRYVGA